MNTTNPYAPPQAAVQDVAGPDTTAEPAGRGTRLGAFILDGFIASVLIYVPLGIGVSMNGHPLFMNAHFNFQAMVGSGSWLPLLGLVAWSWLTVVFVARNGQSIAKKMLGIKVVRSDGSKASLGRIFWLRNVVNGVLAFVPLYGLVDLLLIFGESRQCVHDKIADTIVIKAANKHPIR
jgi:uncharacterized RDD family membrane protein YckC